ncbi:PTS sugar transporter subunit IIA [Brenneria corticis]|uniref:Ascorbate-specific PTS system EIIA component n=1 Tax=Brenneria corticis TaxID=2173106 RepID=A0A2U1TUE7_9GAMM|nr:PTS sugar transporter subunit IIA [Brenneria sp. CFCC 11842]PWC13020.1 PTS sugar transporter subunit IIA [Brenneria sp. CFCC 11842]
MSSTPLFSASQFVESCADWRDAIILCARPLIAQGAISPGYHDAIIRETEQTGPWYLLSPGFALPHARPEDGVTSAMTHLSLLRIREYVRFPGDEKVGLLILLAAGNGEQHLQTIQTLMCWLDENDRLARLLRIETAPALTQFLQAERP